jgi:hypothetical protein
MITKPAVLECTRCGKIFIGYDRDVRPKGWPRCLKCSAREAWATLTGVVGGEKSSSRRRPKRRSTASTATTRGAGARRGSARKRR